jgi:hypothetical protein
MDRKKIVAIIILILILAGILFFIFMKPSPTTSGNETKLGIYNNGTTWIHVLMAFENVTIINGTTNKSLGGQGPLLIENGSAKNMNITTFYVEAWLKPNENETSVDNLTGKEIIDLSNILGYGNQAIPNGATFPTKIWIGLYGPGINESAEPVNNMNFMMQGWSMNSSPPSNPRLVTVKAIDPELYSFQFQNIHVNPLPSGITDNELNIINDPSTFATLLSGMGNDTQYFDVTFVDVDSNFKLIIDRNSLLNFGSINTNPNGSVTVTKNNSYGPHTLCVLADH